MKSVAFGFVASVAIGAIPAVAATSVIVACTAAQKVAVVQSLPSDVACLADVVAMALGGASLASLIGTCGYDLETLVTILLAAGSPAAEAGLADHPIAHTTAYGEALLHRAAMLHQVNR